MTDTTIKPEASNLIGGVAKMDTQKQVHLSDNDVGSTPTAPTMQAEFEAWVKTVNQAEIKWIGHSYANAYMAAQWEGWQAAIAAMKPAVVDEKAISDLADQIIIACLTGVSKGDLKADLIKWLRPYLRDTKPVSVDVAKMREALSQIHGILTSITNEDDIFNAILIARNTLEDTAIKQEQGK